MTISIFERAKTRHVRELLVRPGVVWVGIGPKTVKGRPTGETAVIVGVVRKLSPRQLDPAAMIPPTLRHSVWSLRKRVKTDVVEAGVIRALTPWTQRWRPVPAGVSIGHFQITAGTLGAFVRRGGKLVILSNNHVLANSNVGAVGDAILQPGTHDGGTGQDAVAKLEAFVPLVFDGQIPGLPDKCPFAQAVTTILNLICSEIGSKTRYVVYDAPLAGPNYVDAAVALPIDNADFVGAMLDRNGEPTIPAPMVVQPATIGLSVSKSGRTTQWTEGNVTAVNVTVQVQYGEGKTVTFEDQVVIGKPGFSAGGDSGSAILSVDGKLVGLLFAGSEQQTIFNRAERVMTALDLSL